MTSGSIADIPATNSRLDLDPQDDELANPEYPDTPPWQAPGFSAWSPSLINYCGSVLATDLGALGTLMQYGAAGHSAINACFWIGFDLNDATWKRIGPRPPPTNGLAGLTYSGSPNWATWQAADPRNAEFDETWGDWDPHGSGIPSGFRQDLGGARIVEGSHTRNSFPYRPASAAGNGVGELVIAWQPTGVQTGTGIQGSHVYDLATNRFSRTANLRPGSGSDVTGHAYHAGTDHVVGQCLVSSQTTGILDLFNCTTRTWTRRTATNSLVFRFDSTCFVLGDLFVQVNHSGSGTFELRAAPIPAAVAGSSFAWTVLTLSASSWPTRANGLSDMVHFELCPTTGNLYAVNGRAGSLTLWRLTPPAAATDTAGLLSGIWVLDTETLTGPGLAGSTYDYRRLQWSPQLDCLIWTGDTLSAAPQAIVPSGV
mgnify:CR=1 FL=1